MDRSALARKPMTELKDIAAHLDMRGYQKLRKAELIDAIIDSGNGVAPRTDDRGQADAQASGARKVLPPSARGAGPESSEDAPSADPQDRRSSEQQSAGEAGSGENGSAAVAPPDGRSTGEDDGQDEAEESGGRKRRNRRDRRKRNRDRQTQENDGGRRDDTGNDNEPGEVRAGVLDILPEGYGFLRTTGYLPGERDVYVSQGQIRKHGLRRGDVVQGPIRQQRSNEKVPALHHIQKVNGEELDDGQVPERTAFDDLPIAVTGSRIDLSGSDLVSARVVDLIAPLVEGQRTLVSTPPRVEGTTFATELAAGIAACRPDSHVMALCVDARPEDLAAMRSDAAGEVIASTFDQPAEDHVQISELAIERARRLVELGHDVVIVLDSLTRLARACGVTAAGGSRTIAPGVEATSLYPPKRFMASARNIDGGGSLTIVATLLVDTGSAHDDVIAAEFRRVASAEIVLDPAAARQGIWPPVAPGRSYSRDAAAPQHDQTPDTTSAAELVERLGAVESTGTA